MEICIDPPLSNYNLSRFDWTGKIVAVKYKDRYISGKELAGDGELQQFCGKGFYNEFGIETPIGFKETKIGDWFHKIGIGLLRKDDDQYHFNKVYAIKPADFKVVEKPNKIRMVCKSPLVNGYSYLLEKEIELLESGFEIRYFLHNTGEKTITTNEYNHNFLSINKDMIGTGYILKFPFQLKPKQFGETVNREQMVTIGQKELSFKGRPTSPFFFSKLSGGGLVDAKWELINSKHQIGITETGNFQTHLVNLWGWGHVISPELFFHIHINAGQSIKWSRTYHVYTLD